MQRLQGQRKKLNKTAFYWAHQTQAKGILQSEQTLTTYEIDEIQDEIVHEKFLSLALLL